MKEMNMEDLFDRNLVLPEYPRTPHAPIEPNATRDDLIAKDDEFWNSLSNGEPHITEKVDGANMGMTLFDGQPLIRNRSHILCKNYSNLRTVAKQQFAPVWNWFYQNKDWFPELELALGFMPSLYGEWLYARHTVEYNELPDYFIVFDVYDPEKRIFLDSAVYRPILEQVGFKMVPELYRGSVTEKMLLGFRDGKSEFSSERKEGIYLRVMKDGAVEKRFKMVRNNFIAGERWDNKQITKNRILK